MDSIPTKAHKEIWLMTEEEQKAIYNILPDAEIEYDLDGQIIIYTGTWDEILPTEEVWLLWPKKKRKFY